MTTAKQPLVITIAGPKGSGKSELTARLFQDFKSRTEKLVEVIDHPPYDHLVSDGVYPDVIIRTETRTETSGVAQDPTPPVGPLTSNEHLKVGDVVRRVTDYGTLARDSVRRITKIITKAHVLVEDDPAHIHRLIVNFAFVGRPDADGWMPWSGGENPVPGRQVEIVMRTCAGINGAPLLSDGLRWDNIDSPSDITSFRLVPEVAKEAIDPTEKVDWNAPDTAETARLRAMLTAPVVTPEQVAADRVRAAIDELNAALSDAMDAGLTVVTEGCTVHSTSLPVWKNTKIMHTAEL